MAELLEWLRAVISVLQLGLEEAIPELPQLTAAITLFMGTSLGWKYLKTDSNPFKEHSTILPILITTMLVHHIFGFLMKYFNINQSLRGILSFFIWFVSGVLVTELFLFMLCTPMWNLISNVVLALLITLWCFSNTLASFFRNLLSIGPHDQPQQLEDGIMEMATAQQADA